MEDNKFQELPHSLTAASNLTRLSLAINSSLQVDSCAVDDVLARLPRLRSLDLSGVQVSISALVRLVRQLPQLDLMVNGDEDTVSFVYTDD